MVAAKKLRVDIVTPVYYKEAPYLESRMKQQVEFFEKHLGGYAWRVVVANNGSRKDAVEVAKELSKRCSNVVWRDIDRPGRGWSLSTAWVDTDADLVMYMDADLATNLKSVRAMLDLLARDECDVAVGSRYVAGADSRRTWHRLALSKGYNVLLRWFLGLRVLDAQCGFKALKRSVAERVIPLTRDRRWFFDSELLFRAQRLGCRIREVPVEWEEQDETSVQIFFVVVDYVRNIFRLLFSKR